MSSTVTMLNPEPSPSQRRSFTGGLRAGVALVVLLVLFTGWLAALPGVHAVLHDHSHAGHDETPTGSGPGCSVTWFHGTPVGAAGFVDVTVAPAPGMPAGVSSLSDLVLPGQPRSRFPIGRAPPLSFL